jgi:quercetin dioxygenase-like cupin family protein
MSPTGQQAPLIRARDEGSRRWFFGGGVHTWKATEEETGGAFLLFEMTVEQGKVTPLHSHPDSDETMYVLEGEILVHIDGRDYPVAAGGLASAARGVPHAFMVVSETARVLCLHTPGRCEAFYLDASEPLAEGGAPGVVDFDRVRASAARNGDMELLGPPPFSPAAARVASAG